MKIRTGFVSNSSSSSFMCDITGELFEGYDTSLTEFGLAECTNGHTFLYEDYPEVEEWINTNDDGAYEVPKHLCPVCNGKARERIAKRLKSEMSRLNITLEDLK